VFRQLAFEPEIHAHPSEGGEGEAAGAPDRRPIDGALENHHQRDDRDETDQQEHQDGIATFHG
jgi:hypothetical protein